MRWIFGGFFAFASLTDWLIGVSAWFGWYHPSPGSIALHAYCGDATVQLAIAWLVFTVLAPAGRSSLDR